MRATKAQSYRAQPPVRAPKAQSYRTRPILHDRAGTFASMYYIKTKNRLSGLSVLAAFITLPSHDVSTPDSLKMKATSSGIK